MDKIELVGGSNHGYSMTNNTDWLFISANRCCNFVFFWGGEKGGTPGDWDVPFLGYIFGLKINFWVYFIACRKFFIQVFGLEYIFGSDCHKTKNYMLIVLTRYELCAVRIRHIISTTEDVQYKQVNHQVLVQRGTIQKYFPVDESLLLLLYQVKMARCLWQAAKIH